MREAQRQFDEAMREYPRALGIATAKAERAAGVSHETSVADVWGREHAESVMPIYQTEVAAMVAAAKCKRCSILEERKRYRLCFWVSAISVALLLLALVIYFS